MDKYFQKLAEHYMGKYLQKLSDIYKAIDHTYSEVQRYYNFNCKGCTDNCCATKFYHHTLIEELYLAEGLKRLDEDKRKYVISSSENVVRLYKSSSEDIRVMCPINENGLCILYEYRPMICRLHGVPYELLKMDMSIENGTGCYRFIVEKESDLKHFKINRTQFYLEMAELEREVREQFSFKGKYKKTTAEMILSITHGKSLEEY